MYFGEHPIYKGDSAEIFKIWMWTLALEKLG